MSDKTETEREELDRRLREALDAKRLELVEGEDWVPDVGGYPMLTLAGAFKLMTSSASSATEARNSHTGEIAALMYGEVCRLQGLLDETLAILIAHSQKMPLETAERVVHIARITRRV